MSYAKDVPTSLAAKIIHFVESSNESPVATSVRADSPLQGLVLSHPNSMSSIQQTPREAIFATGASTNPEKITALVGYISTRDGAAASVKEVQASFRKAGDTLPKNFSRDAREAVRLGYLYEEAPGHFVLTDSARIILNSGFKNNPIKTNSGAKSKRGVSSKKKRGAGFGVVREEVAKLETTTEGWGNVPGFWEVPTKTKKVLWLLALAKKNSLTGLSSREVEHLALKLGERIPVHHVSVFVEPEVKKGHINHPNNQGLWMILKNGEDALVEIGKKDIKKG